MEKYVLIERTPVPDNDKQLFDSPMAQPSAADFMINYALDDMDAFIARLTAKGVAILKRTDDSTGRLAWIVDPEHNKIELWEPKRATP